VTAGPPFLRKAADRLNRIGPRPVLLGRYIAHTVINRWQRRELRRRYGDLVAHPPAGVRLLIPDFDLPSATALPEALSSSADHLRTEAEGILTHRFDLLGSGSVELGNSIDWHRDFKSDYRWPKSLFYQDVKVTRLHDDSDAKVPWELSRCHHLLTLARAARLFEDLRFAAELESELTSWLDENPTGYGVNWTNPMEVAIRAVNWVWAVRTLETWRPLERRLRERVTTSLQAHGRHIARNLEGTPYLRSNHYLADLLGLLVIGAAIKDDPAAERFLRLARRGFEREILRQVRADGIGFEASLSYHALALEIFLVARVAIAWTGNSFSAAFDRRLDQMLTASRALRHPNGRWPQIGDSDSGRILPAGFARPATIDHLLWIGAEVLETQRPLAGPPHEEVAWTLGIDAWRRVAQRSPAEQNGSVPFPKSGFFALRAGRTHVVARCGDVGQNGNGGHAHNDLLSFELSCGSPLVVDSGTYVYTADPGQRNAFRATRAHSTVVVSGEEINPLPATDLFALRQVARPRIEQWKVGADGTRLVASHDGYRRLNPGVIHSRTFALDRSGAQLTITDELLGSGFQDAESFLHLAPGIAVTQIAEDAFQIEPAGREVVVRFFGLDLIERTEGWTSDSYGTRSRAQLLVARVSGALPLRFGYRFELSVSTHPGGPPAGRPSHG
jgi:hypothetical protein